MVKGKLTGCAHAGIFCTNREETVRFYEDVLGCECLFRATSTGLHIAVVQLGDFKIELLEPEEPDDRIVPSATNSMNHIAIACKDIKSVVKELKEKGVVFETEEDAYVPGFGQPPTDIDIIFFRGPNGERFELYEEL